MEVVLQSAPSTLSRWFRLLQKIGWGGTYRLSTCTPSFFSFDRFHHWVNPPFSKENNGGRCHRRHLAMLGQGSVWAFAMIRPLLI